MVGSVDGWLRAATAPPSACWPARSTAPFWLHPGQALVGLLGTFYAVGPVIGLNFGVLIGLASGLLTFIPMSARSPGSSCRWGWPSCVLAGLR
jgi:hypothetical protein